MTKEIVPLPTDKLTSATITTNLQPACELTIHDRKLTVYNHAQPEILDILLKELNSNG